MNDGKCSAINKDGRPCSALAWRDHLCRWHHPDLEAQRTEGRRKGGAARSNAARAAKRLPDGVLTTDELRGLLGTTIQDVRAGRVEPGVGSSVASLARAYVAVTEAGAVETLEREMDEIRALIAARRLA